MLMAYKIERLLVLYSKGIVPISWLCERYNLERIPIFIGSDPVMKLFERSLMILKKFLNIAD